MNASGFFLCSLCFMLAGCSFNSLIWKDSQQDVHFAGYIKTGDYERFQKLVSGSTKRVVIRSAGGDAEEGIKLAQLIQTHKLSILVDKYCLSACAQLLFVAASSRELPDDAFLAFHVSKEEAFWIESHAEMARLSQEEEQEIAKFFDGFERERNEIYQTAGVDIALNDKLLQLASIEPSNVAFDEKSKIFHSSVKSSGCIGWVPDEEGLAQIGIKLEKPYHRPKEETIAKFLDVKEYQIFFGLINDLPRGDHLSCVE